MHAISTRLVSVTRLVPSSVCLDANQLWRCMLIRLPLIT